MGNEKDYAQECPFCHDELVEELTGLVCEDTQKLVYREYRCITCGKQYLLNRQGNISYC